MNINVLEWIDHSAERFSEKTAFSDEKNAVSFRRFADTAKSIGCAIANILNGARKMPVVVMIGRDASSLEMLLGVVYSGNFYVPIDTTIPQMRIELMINTLQAPLIISSRANRDLLERLGFEGSILYYEDIADGPVDTALLADIRRNTIDTDPLYCLFTSGSTGTPKGVLVTHRSVIDLIEQFSDTFGFSEKNIFGNQAPFDFDVSVKDIYSTLRNGATMHIIPKTFFSFPIKLIEHINENSINTVIWATSAMRIVANFKALDKTLPLSIQTVMFSGEVMPNKVLNYWRRHLPGARYVNLYGPTEITCNCTYYIVDREFDDADPLPIGIPFRNTDILLLSGNEPASPGETGEICVRGTSLALGYYNNPQKTAAAFVQNPLNSTYPELIYRTGDLGRYNDRAELLFLSRKDSQIKHMGHRIELGEIESAANALDFVGAACCLYDEPNQRIVMCYQAAEQRDRQIVLALMKVLPKYMVPNRLIWYRQLPMSKNAKIDRVKLRQEYDNGAI